MRILLSIPTAYTGATRGVARSMRTMLEWLAQAGHDCRVLSGARFGAKPAEDIDQHLAGLGVPLRRHPPSRAFTRSVRKPANVVVGRPTVEFTLRGIPVTTLLTRAKPGSPDEQFESDQLLFMLDGMLRHFAPDVLMTVGDDPGDQPIVREIMRRSKQAGAVTVFALHSHGFDDRALFKHADHVFTCSEFLTKVYRDALGLSSIAMEPAIDWSEVQAPPDLRRFVTFVHPSLDKGLMLFARIADMLGNSRPDIPVLVVQSGSGAGKLNEIPGLDFSRHPQIVAAPPTDQPSDFFALTRILLVPSLVAEPFGRVAAEALISGIPPLVSDRGALPSTVRGAGRVIAVPADLTPATETAPSREAARPWVDAICELWDDAPAYDAASKTAFETASQWYSEPRVREKYVAYFASITQTKVS